MRTINIILASIFVASAVISCNKVVGPEHSSDSQEPEMVPVTITVSREGVLDVDTKVYITSSGSFNWKSGDKISLFAGGVNNPLTNSTEDGSIAEFGGTVPAESGFPQYALYPYQKNAALNGDGSITATLPKVQTVVEAGDFYQCPEALLSVGKLDDAGSQLQLKNVFSLVMITVPAETSFSSITLLSNNGEPLSGTVKVNPESAECSVVSGDPVVTIKPANGTLAAGKYMVAVLPETLKGGIKVIVVADAVKQRNNTGEIKFNRNEGLKMPDALLSALKDYSSELTCASELIAWANIADMFPKSTTITLEDDIALTPEQAAQYVEAHNFYGTFDGHNHKISGLTCPLFGDMQGIVKDLEVEANISYDGAETTQIKGKVNGIGILAQYLKHDKISAAKVENVTTSGSLTITNTAIDHAQYVGGICGGTNGVPVTGCANNAAITVNGQITGKLLVGGIVGVCQSDVKGNLKDCTNAGAVTISSTASSTDILTVGGIAGNVLRSITVDNCDNSGEITNSAASATTFYTGGIVGFWDVASQVAKTANILNCDNTGAVTDNSKYATAVDHITAGVVASINASDPEIGAEGVTKSHINVAKCNNKGVITNTAANTKNTVNGGIVGILNHYGIIEECINMSTSGSTANSVVVGKSNTTITTSTRISMGGIVARFNQNAYIHNCKNDGRVYLISGVTCPDVRMGGIAGCSYHTELIEGKSLVTYEGCKNYGTILNAAPGCVATAHVGGIYGSAVSSSNCKAIIVKDCVNKVGANERGIRISNDPTGTNKAYVCMGGICGCTYYPDSFKGCKHYGDVYRKSGNIERCGGIFGSHGGQTTKITIDTYCRVGGKVRGITIDETNAKNFLGYNSSTGFTSDLTHETAYWDGTE